MLTNVFKPCINLQSRPWLQLAMVGSAGHLSCARYLLSYRKYGCLVHQRGPTLLQKTKILNGVNSDQYHNKGQEDSRGFKREGIGIISFIAGSAVLGFGSALCKEKLEENQDKSLISSCDVSTKCDGEDVVGSKSMEDIAKNQAIKINKKCVLKDDAQTQSIERVTLQEAVRQTRKLLNLHMIQTGTPGLVAAVSVNGKTVWVQGLGFADVENSVRCSPDTVMRIASISKSLTMTAVAKLWEAGKLDLDAPVQKYVPYFPVKSFEGKEVTITTRHLLSHQSGIRHYKLKDPKKQNDSKKKTEKETDQGEKEIGPKKNQGEASEKKTIMGSNKNTDKKKRTEERNTKNENQSKSNAEGDANSSSALKGEKTEATEKGIQDAKNHEDNILSPEDTGKKEAVEKEENSQTSVNTPEKKKEFLQKLVQGKANKKKKKKEESEFDLKEYYVKETFDRIEDAVKLFQDDELFFKPGEGFLYTTHGWTLVSGVVEGAAGKPFTQVITQLFHDLGLNDTYLDKHSPIIYNRARCYIRDEHGKLKNAPYVDNSYKWAGGGFLSTVNDLTKFGNAMLYASQQDRGVLKENQQGEGTTPRPGYLKASTMNILWTPVSGTNMGWDQDGGYGLGWGAVPEKQTYGCCRETRQYASHTGGAVGASSVLLILPKHSESGEVDNMPPEGVVVALIANMQGVGLNKVALRIAKLFESLEQEG